MDFKHSCVAGCVFNREGQYSYMSAGDWKDLYKAVDEGNFDLVEFHVKSNVNLNYQHPEILMTVLVTAIKNGHTEIALYLLQNGADPKLESYYDQLTPLQAAVRYKNSQVLEKLNLMGIKQTWLSKLLQR